MRRAVRTRLSPLFPLALIATHGCSATEPTGTFWRNNFPDRCRRNSLRQQTRATDFSERMSKQGANTFLAVHGVMRS